MIRIENLCKQYGSAVVLDHISLTFEPGRIYGLTGRNGSGKTMFLKHLLGLVRPTSGRILYDGLELGKDMEMPDSVGAIIENPGFLPEYTGLYNLELLAMIRGRIGTKECREAMKLTGLDPDSHKKVHAYSLGMKQRLGIAQALMEDPDMLFLDEPLSGLDDEGVDDIRKILLEEKERGKLILIASHNKEDIDILCNEVYRFNHGKVQPV